MKTRLALVTLLTATLLLSGCAVTSTDASPSETPAAVESVAPTLSAAEIVTLDDGIEWARGLDSSASSTELSEGITKIGKLVPEQDIWFATNNEIGMDLISLNSDVLAEPEAAGAKVDDLNLIVDDIEAAIAKGNKP